MESIGKNKSIKNQIQIAVSNSFSENTDKHAYKQQDDQEVKVFSYSEKFRLLDTAKMLNNYIKENFPDVKQIKDVNSNVIQDFINTKAKTCTQNTVNTYSNSLNKIAAICNKNYSSCNLTWKQDVVIPNAFTQKSKLRGVANQIPLADLNKICNYAKKNYSISGQIILCQLELGLRVNELVSGIKVENIDLKNNILHLDNTKGGKKLNREITPELKALLEKNIQQRNITSGRLFPITENAVNTYLRRTEDKLGIKGIYSIHNIRSAIAQKFYDNLRENGVNKDEAIKQTSIWLNHGPDREKLLEKSYIEIW
ncbi:tyrosine-type recombinase/integrase [Clostridium sp.]|uniref:tyrosine-type recombinase/integrase n=1 Tax=Clostridium sp. TaxID=1506 RepID=UPI0026355369|nr:tyrosine-type recombinase/integrase [Clostridium sp.]